MSYSSDARLCEGPVTCRYGRKIERLLGEREVKGREGGRKGGNEEGWEKTEGGKKKEGKCWVGRRKGEGCGGQEKGS